MTYPEDAQLREIANAMDAAQGEVIGSAYPYVWGLVNAPTRQELTEMFHGFPMYADSRWSVPFMVLWYAPGVYRRFRKHWTRRETIRRMWGQIVRLWWVV